jgi:O-antigen/teichoic acid export membrane protein
MGVRISTQAMAFFLLLFAGRILSVELFGIFVLSSIIMQFALTQLYSGVYNYILREPSFDENEGAALSLQFLMSIFLSLATIASASVVYAFGWGDLLSALILATAPIPIFGAYISWKEAILLRNSEVKYYYVSLFIAEVIAFAFGVVLLLKGFHVWALLGNHFVRAFVLMATYGAKSAPLPKPSWNIAAISNVMRYAAGLYGSSALGFVSAHGASVILGAFLSSSAVGLFRMGDRAVGAAHDIFSQTMRVLTWQAVGRMSREGRMHEDTWSKLLAVYLSIVIFALGAFALLANELTIWALGERWIGAVAIIQIICVAKVISAIGEVASAQLAAMAETRFLFNTQLLGVTILLVSLSIAANISLLMVAFALLPPVMFTTVMKVQRLVALTETDFVAVFRTVSPGIAAALAGLAAVQLAATNMLGYSEFIRIFASGMCGLVVFSGIICFPLRSWSIACIETVSKEILPGRAEEQVS